MKQELFITFDKPWYPNKDTVDRLLQELDMGEEISLADFEKACIREGRKFIVKFK